MRVPRRADVDGVLHVLTWGCLQPTLPQLAEAIAAKDSDGIKAWAVANPFWSTLKLLARESGRRSTNTTDVGVAATQLIQLDTMHTHTLA